MSELQHFENDARSEPCTRTKYTYDPASNLATATYPNGLQSTFAYDPLNRLTALSTPVSSYSYQLGPTGNRTSATEGTGRALTWSYDGVYRLTNESISSDPANKNGTVGYTLDPVGNRKAETATLGGLNPGSFNYNADDEATTDGYDLNGNTVSTSGKTFAYDLENRMTSMNGGAVTMLYDGDGNRVAKTVSSVTTRYLVDDLNPTGYPQVVEELSANGTVARRYSYGIQLISQSQIENSVWTPSFYETDGAGSIRQLTDAAGAITDTYEYDAFGNEIGASGTTPNNYLYRGEQWDSDLGLYYLRARYYNPLTGRFISVDSEAGEGQRRYQYAAADPVNGMDPTGNEAIVEWALLTFYPGRLPFNLGFQLSWCGFAGSGYLLGCGSGAGGSGAGSGGSGGSGGPPPPPPPRRPHLPHAVKDVGDGKITNGWTIKGRFHEREVTYWAYDVEPDGSLGYRDTTDSIALIEKTVAGSNQGTCISIQDCPGSPREFVDDQRVFQNNPFTVERYWSVGGEAAQVWNLKTQSLAPFEILRLNYGANPPFAITYGK